MQNITANLNFFY